MSIKDIYFIDIETVPIKEELTGNIVPLFIKKFNRQISDSGGEGFETNVWWNEAGLSAEFGKVVCVSIGKMHTDKFFIKTICMTDEKKLLTTLGEALENAVILCAHNGKGFDYPFLFRRYVINSLLVPGLLRVAGKKTWDIPHLDTMEMWSHMEWKYRCSLELLAHVLGLPSPKKDMDGSMVGEVYYSPCPNDVLPFDYEASVLKRIGDYCAGDIITLANVYCRMNGLELIKEEQIQYV